MVKIKLGVVGLQVALALASIAAQEPANPAPVSLLPSAPMPVHAPQFRSHLWDDYYTAGITCSTGISHANQVVAKPATSCGGALGFMWMWFEVGAFTPQAVQTGPTGYWTADVVVPLDPWHSARAADRRPSRRILPLATLGYTRLFQTANALDFSAGADVALNSGHSVRFELKDYLSFNGGTQHNAMVRVTFVGWVEDP